MHAQTSFSNKGHDLTTHPPSKKDIRFAIIDKKSTFYNIFPYLSFHEKKTPREDLLPTVTLSLSSLFFFLFHPPAPYRRARVNERRARSRT